jgi:hypothetical protein
LHAYSITLRFENLRLYPGVAAYLVRAEGDRAVVERLQVTEDGISEDEFGKVAEELLGERGRMYEAREGV